MMNYANEDIPGVVFIIDPFIGHRRSDDDVIGSMYISYYNFW